MSKKIKVKDLKKWILCFLTNSELKAINCNLIINS